MKAVALFIVIYTYAVASSNQIYIHTHTKQWTTSQSVAHFACRLWACRFKFNTTFTCIDTVQFLHYLVYRLPMYEILEFLWTIPAYRPSIELSADEVSSRCVILAPNILQYYILYCSLINIVKESVFGMLSIAKWILLSCNPNWCASSQTLVQA